GGGWGEGWGLGSKWDGRWNKQKCECGNQNREESIPVDANQVVLQRRDDEKRPEQRPVIAASCWNQGNVFPQREKRKQREQNQGSSLSYGQCKRENCAHLPPSADARIQVVGHSPSRFRRRYAVKNDSDDRGHNKQPMHPAEKNQQTGVELGPNKLGVAAGNVILCRQCHSFPFRRSAMTALRARSRKSCLFSPSSP